MCRTAASSHALGARCLDPLDEAEEWGSSRLARRPCRWSGEASPRWRRRRARSASRREVGVGDEWGLAGRVWELASYLDWEQREEGGSEMEMKMEMEIAMERSVLVCVGGARGGRLKLGPSSEGGGFRGAPDRVSAAVNPCALPTRDASHTTLPLDRCVALCSTIRFHFKPRGTNATLTVSPKLRHHPL